MLLDTHIAIWAALRPAALLKVERASMQRPGTQLVLSAVSIWELRLKWDSFHGSGERKGLIAPDFMVAYATAVKWTLLPLTVVHATASLAEKLDHRDPFDELLLVQAQEEGIRLLTRDRKLARHPWAFAGSEH